MKRVLLRLQSAPRRLKQAILVVGDVLVFPVMLLLALSIRTDQVVWPTQVLLPVLAASTVITVSLLLALGAYRTVVRAFDEHFLASVMFAILGATLLLFCLNLTGLFSLPRSVPITTGFFQLIWVWGSRSLVRHAISRLLNLRQRQRPMLIYGAGSAGRQLLAAIMQVPEFRPVAYLDDNDNLIGSTLSGLPVFAGSRAAELVARYGITDIIIALPSASRARRREILTQLEPLPVHVRALPGMDQLIGGQIRLSDAREVDIADLLGRDPVPPRPDLMGRDIAGRVVMVTGAGGSIGSELCRQIAGICPRKLVLYEQSEIALYQIERELLASHPALPVVTVLGSVVDQNLMLSVLRQHGVETVYHAAAYKHVPLVEANPFEGLRNNVWGTRACALAAREAGVSRFVLISTDKAVRPTNVMGASKRLSELVLQALAEEGQGKTRYTMVRFGNVLGSSGSVVPLFRQQLEAGGPITVTHPEVTRYFMTIPEAAQLVIQAGAMSENGDVFLLDMGQSVRIADLARQMIHLSGLRERSAMQPDGDIEIVYTGLRPGEKLYEELLIGTQGAQATEHGRIRKTIEAHLSWSALQRVLDEIDQLAHRRDSLALKRFLLWHVEGYQPYLSDEDVLVPDAQPEGQGADVAGQVVTLHR